MSAQTGSGVGAVPELGPPPGPPGAGWVIRGNPTPEEVVAVVTVLLAQAAAAQGAAAPRPGWASRLRGAFRLVLVPRWRRGSGADGAESSLVA